VSVALYFDHNVRAAIGIGLVEDGARICRRDLRPSTEIDDWPDDCRTGIDRKGGQPGGFPKSYRVSSIVDHIVSLSYLLSLLQVLGRRLRRRRPGSIARGRRTCPTARGAPRRSARCGWASRRRFRPAPIPDRRAGHCRSRRGRGRGFKGWVAGARAQGSAPVFRVVRFCGGGTHAFSHPRTPVP